jgi:tRNA 2-selenouridine synthase
MIETVCAESFLNTESYVPVIDVRSPAEFAAGHIPDAVNIPLFDDAQRALVGTTYKDFGHEEAVVEGLRIVGPKMADFITTVKDLLNKRSKEFLKDRRVRIHCWRGGMRSQSFAWLMAQGSLEPIVLDGGYKRFRSAVQQSFDRPYNLMVLSGLTGAGKTKYLHLLKNRSEQVIDLEGIANHRGSAFGGVGLGDQPTTEAFENQLFDQLEQQDNSRRIWVEDEGNRIGAVNVPKAFYQQIRFAPAVFIDATVDRRLDHLLEVYGDLDLSGLAYSVEKIRKRLGGQHVAAALEALEKKDFRTAAEIVLKYYDKTYLKAVDTMPREVMARFPAQSLSDAEVVDAIIETANANALHVGR